jgi:hypothetical protein
MKGKKLVTAAASASSRGKLVITEVRDFAGQKLNLKSL